MKTKFNWKGYWSPTPKSIRKIADGLLVSTVTISAILTQYEHEQWAMICALSGVLFKFISNMFTQEDEATTKEI